MISQGQVCGTGLSNQPRPGDPSNHSVLRARPVFGGIQISWTFPVLNPFAVAHTLLFRSTSSDFNTSAEIAGVSGNSYFDQFGEGEPVLYYYWIKFVSVHGTYGDLIGPVSCTANPTITDMMQMLTDRIDRGVLAQSLKQEIDRISFLADGLTQEATYRAADDATLADAFNGLQASFDETVSLVLTETHLRSTADSSLAQQITTVQSQLDGNLASVQTLMQTNIDTTNGVVRAIGALWTAKVSVNGLIGGFGVYNDGQEVEAGFDVDLFWVGRTNANKVKPFIIYEGVVYIDESRINRLTFSKLRDESGNFLVSNGRIQAQYIKVNEASIENASITNAKIGNAAIDTLKVAGNSITVSGQCGGTGWQEFWLNAPYGGTINIVACNMGSDSGAADILYVFVNGVVVNAFRGPITTAYVSDGYATGWMAPVSTASATEVNSVEVGGGNHHIAVYSSTYFRVLGLLTMR